MHTWTKFTSENSKILDSLTDNWFIKTIIAAFVGLLSTPVNLVVLISFLVFVDLITGVMRAISQGERITASRLWATGVKVIQYTLFLACTTAVANSFPLLYGFQNVAYMYVALTELKSVIENLFQAKGKSEEIWDNFKKVWHKHEK